ncbi:peptidyl-tRNA hydrolase 2, mitochondrial-like isoform X2 [Homarus americanus]|uniref:peptidyl-tRNA hydrolase 2, mitochondrial-like isoform X2 n=1 Tax=Homarus americanus TaxID=6706 RepID=UPI001C44C312|nr:peptidyl-tRNA hydrolase 2, mitochondrial-like isoform X2 [Homarus americanus]
MVEDDDVEDKYSIVSTSSEEEYIFKEFCHEKFANSKTTPALSKKRFDKILNYLKEPNKCPDSKLKFYIKKNNFFKISFPDIGLQETIGKKDKDNSLKRVVCYEEFYSVIKNYHENVVEHAPARKTFKAIQEQYALIPREAVEKYCSICTVCQQRGAQKNTAPLKHDIAKGIRKCRQCCHATLKAYKQIQKMNPKVLRAWEMNGQPKVILKVNDEATMMDVTSLAMDAGMITSLIHDAGCSQIAPESPTVLGLGPGSVEVLDQITGHLKQY